MIDHIADGLLSILEEIKTMRCGDKVALLVCDRQFLASRSDETEFGNVRPFLYRKCECHRHHRFNACAVDFTITLCRVAVTTGEQRSGYQDREKRSCSGRQ